MSPIDSLRALAVLVSNHPVLERLFFASLEFAVLAVAMGIVIRVARIRSPRLVSVLWLLVLAKPIVSLVVGSPLPIVELAAPTAGALGQTNAGTASLQSIAGADALPSELMPPSSPFIAADRSVHGGGRPDRAGLADNDRAEASPDGDVRENEEVSRPSLTPWLSLAWLVANSARIVSTTWLAGVAFFAIAGLVDRIRLRRLIAAARAPKCELAGRYATLASALGVKRLPRLLETDDLESPAIARVLAPVILVPSWLVRENDSAKLDWSLRHELMHWKLLDPLANVVRELAQTLFYFHPAVWWVGKRWEEAAELACDRAIVTDEAESHDYAEQLYQMLVQIRTRRRAPMSSGLFATRTQIGRRIAALLGSPLKSPARLGVLALVCVSLLAAVTLAVGAAFVESPEAREASEPARLAIEQEQLETDTIEVAGRVLDPDGKPFVGARLYVSPYSFDDKPELPVRATSGKDGSFRFKFSKSEPAIEHASWATFQIEPWRSAAIVAVADGYGPDWMRAGDLKLGTELTLRLAKDDVPISGRILDLEGRPIAGVNVRVTWLREPVEHDLTRWIEGARAEDRGEGANEVRTKELLGDPTGPPKSVTSGSDGRFELSGFGRERIVILQFESPTIERRIAVVLTRQGALTEMEGVAYTAAFDHVTAPTQPLVGTVRDRETGEPLAGVIVNASLGTVPSPTVTAKTDEQGRFRLVGMPDGKRYFISAGPDDDRALLRAGQVIEDRPGLDAIPVDFALVRGVAVKGRLIDSLTGEPVRGSVQYFVHPDNPFPRTETDFINEPHDPAFPFESTAKDGSFTIVAPPGPGVVAALDHSDDRYMLVDVEDPSVLAALQDSAAFVQAIATVDLSADAPSSDCELKLLPAPTVIGRVFGPDDQPLAGVSAFGLKANPSDSTQILPTPEFTVTGLNPSVPRIVVFQHEEQDLAATIELRGDQPSPLVVRLQPRGGVAGRLVDGNGRPEADIKVTVSLYVERRFNFLLAGIKPHWRDVMTDTNGRFKIEGMIPRLNYQLVVSRDNLPSTMLERLEVGYGETKDLGDFSTQPNEQQQRDASDGSHRDRLDGSKARAQPSPSSESQEDEPFAGNSETTRIGSNHSNRRSDEQVTVAGRVLNPDGKPFAGARLYLHKPSKEWPKRLAEIPVRATTGSDGAFRFGFSASEVEPPYSHAPLDHVWVVAVAAGFGPDVAGPDMIKSGQQLTLNLAKDDLPVVGRVVNLEGQAVPNAEIQLESILVPSTGEMDAWIQSAQLEELGPAPATRISKYLMPAYCGLSERLTTNAAGEFRIAGVGRDRIVRFKITGPSIVYQDVVALTRSEPQLRGTYSPHIQRLVYDASCTHIAEPSQAVVGTVRDRSTGQPMPGVRVTGYRGHEAITDAEGRYRLPGMPKADGLEIAARPSAGAAYFPWTTRTRSRVGLDPVTVDFELVRGIMIQGRVTDTVTGEPVSASCTYFPMTDNPHLGDVPGFLATGVIDLRPTKPDGSFSVVALPGPGVVCVRAMDENYQVAQIALLNIDRRYVIDGNSLDTKPHPISFRGGASNYHVAAMIDPKPGQAQEVHIQLSSGETRKGAVTDPDGKPVSGATVWGLTQTGWWKSLETDSFEVKGLRPNDARWLVFLHRERRLGAAVAVRADDINPLTVPLQPCGTITGRAIDLDGDPLATLETRLFGIVLPDGSNMNQVMAVATTDNHGRFLFEGLVPGVQYEYNVYESGRYVARRYSVEPDETKDIGDCPKVTR